MSLRIDFTDRHEQHSEDVRDYAREKVAKLSRYFDLVNHIEVIMDKAHDKHVVEVLATANNHMHFVGHAEDASVLVAVDRVVDKLERQVVRAKERLKDHHRGEGTHKSP